MRVEVVRAPSAPSRLSDPAGTTTFSVAPGTKLAVGWKTRVVGVVRVHLPATAGERRGIGLSATVAEPDARDIGPALRLDHHQPLEGKTLDLYFIGCSDLRQVLDDAAALLELELELELHAARTPSDTTATTAAAVRVRQCTDLFMCSAFSWLTASHLSSERARAPPLGAASPPRASRKKTPFTGSTSKRCFFALL